MVVSFLIALYIYFCYPDLSGPVPAPFGRKKQSSSEYFITNIICLLLTYTYDLGETFDFILNILNE